jgi:hypothetical protein
VSVPLRSSTIFVDAFVMLLIESGHSNQESHMTLKTRRRLGKLFMALACTTLLAFLLPIPTWVYVSSSRPAEPGYIIPAYRRTDEPISPFPPDREPWIPVEIKGMDFYASGGFDLPELFRIPAEWMVDIWNFHPLVGQPWLDLHHEGPFGLIRNDVWFPPGPAPGYSNNPPPSRELPPVLPEPVYGGVGGGRGQFVPEDLPDPPPPPPVVPEPVTFGWLAGVVYMLRRRGV